MTGSRLKGPIKTNYLLHGQVLEAVTCAKYLGLIFPVISLGTPPDPRLYPPRYQNEDVKSS